MICLHAIWTDSALHVWGERAPLGPEASSPSGVGDERQPAAHLSGEDVPAAMSVMAADELRGLVGELEDGLLASGAAGSSVTLLLPSMGAGPIPSLFGCPPSAMLQEATVPTLRFEPSDALDFLTGLPRYERREVRSGGSLRFWSRAAQLVLELLARQRFIPDLYRAEDGGYCGYWRVVLEGGEASARIGGLIESMPPLCRAQAGVDPEPQAADLVENFLWTSVDALVRRCLEGDELAHAVCDSHAAPGSGKMRWLRTLVGSETRLAGSSEECEAVVRKVRSWLTALEPPAPQRTSRTCLRLHPPAGERQLGGVPLSQLPWRLTVHVQALSDPGLVLDADQLWQGRDDQPPILQRPFDGAREQVREDLARAARHFEPLALAEGQPFPAEFSLTLEESYRFLRDAAPMLEAEGVGIWLPSWWHSQHARLGIRLDVRPSSVAPPGSEPAMRLDALVAYDWRAALGDDDITVEELTALAREKTPLVNLRGHWTEVQTAEVAAALEFLARNRSGEMTLLEALRRSYMTDDADTGLPVVGLRAAGWIEELLSGGQDDEQLEPVGPPEGFHGELRPYQLSGLAWLAFLSRHGLGACLADDMGLGKTIQTISLWLHERAGAERGKPGPTLLVVPMSLVGNWQREIGRFAPSLRVMVHHGIERFTGAELREQVQRYDVVISTYGLIHRDFEHLAQVSWHRVALDEAQNIKNPAARQAQAIRALPAVQRLALTGTPVENRLSELWSILDFLNPGYLGSANEFRRRFAVPIERHHDSERAEKLRHAIRPFVLRRLKRDPNILRELPERMDMKVFCNLTREQAALYEAVVTDMLGQIDRSGGIQRRGLILAALVKLKQICNHPVQFLRVRDGAGRNEAEETLPQRSGKCERLREMLEEVLAEGDAALVFTQFRQMGTLLQRLLQEALDREVLFMHGGTTQKQRDAMVMRFQEARGDVPVFLLSLRAGGVGLNLTAANHVFHFDRWWNPAVEEQATDRAHRIGQYKVVQVHKFVCIGTLEERIDTMIDQKRDLAERIVGTGEDWLTEMSTAALRDLFSLSREAVAEE